MDEQPKPEAESEAQLNAPPQDEDIAPASNDEAPTIPPTSAKPASPPSAPEDPTVSPPSSISQAEVSTAPPSATDQYIYRGLQIQHPSYRIVAPIGRGAMGEVIEAEQTSLNRRVAIKVLSPSLAADPSFVERFHREARALAMLDHPHIVTIFERGKSPCSEGELLFFVMEYVSGPGDSAPTDLKHVLRGGRPQPEQVKRWVSQVADALHHAHQVGVIHRDVKPSNIMLTRRGDAKVSDFGIAAATDSSLTQTKSTMGTFDYMSPEQRSDAAHVDGRTDIFACGVMLYELITGRLPQGAYQPPSFLVPDLPREWDAVVDKAMQADADNRYPDMAEFRDAVNALPTSADAAAAQPVRRKSADERVARHLELARGFAEDIRRLEDDAARFEAADQALAAVVKVEAVDASNEEAEDLRESVQPVAMTLAWQLGEKSYETEQYAQAEAYFQWLVEHDAQHRRAAARLGDLKAKRDAAVARAKSQSDAGDLPAAIATLQQAQRHFPEDSQISEMLNVWRGQSEQARELQEDLPKLEAQARFIELKRRIEASPDAMNQQDARLDHYLDKARKRLEAVQPTLDAARRCIANREFASAGRKTARVLQAVSDHPEALELQAEAQAGEQALQQELNELQRIVDRGRWVHARTMLNALADHSDAYAALSQASTVIRQGLAWHLAQRRWLIGSFAGLMLLGGATMLGFLLASIPDGRASTLLQPLLFSLVQVGLFGGVAVAATWMMGRPRRVVLIVIALVALLFAGIGGIGEAAMVNLERSGNFRRLAPWLEGLITSIPPLMHGIGLALICGSALAVFRGGVDVGRVVLGTALGGLLYGLIAGGLPAAARISTPEYALPLVGAAVVWLIVTAVTLCRKPAQQRSDFVGLGPTRQDPTETSQVGFSFTEHSTAPPQ